MSVLKIMKDELPVSIGIQTLLAKEEEREIHKDGTEKEEVENLKDYYYYYYYYYYTLSLHIET